MGPGVERKPPPLVREIRKVGFAIAGAVSLWAGATYFQQQMMLNAVRQMKATADTVHHTRTDTLLNPCPRPTHDDGETGFPF